MDTLLQKRGEKGCLNPRKSEIISVVPTKKDLLQYDSNGHAGNMSDYSFSPKILGNMMYTLSDIVKYTCLAAQMPSQATSMCERLTILPAQHF